MLRNSTPRARIAFRVGVVGHRPNRLQQSDPEVLAGRIREALLTVKSEVESFRATASVRHLYSAEPPLLRAVSPLAEGTDRIFATQALRAGLDYELCCPFPFPQAEYEKDFTSSESRDEFRSLLSQAQAATSVTVFELDGKRENEPAAYGAAGRIVLNQSDLLVAVWDLEGAAGGGGTVDTLHEAVHFRIPVLWIDARAPHAWRLVRSAADLAELAGTRPRQSEPPPGTVHDQLRAIVRHELTLPAATGPSEGDKPVTAADYFGETRHRYRFAVLWKLFRDLVGSNSLRWPKFRVPFYEDDLDSSWSAETGPESARWANDRLRTHYAWADKLADRYADAYRSTYVFIYLFAALAVLLALLPMAADWASQSLPQALCVVGELVILFSITALLAVEKSHRWHKRWMAYRLLAELIRQLQCLLMLGGGKPLTRVPAHNASFGDPFRSWMYWHLRAVSRATGLPSGSMTKEHLEGCLESLSGLVDGQLSFHRTNHHRSERIAHRLHGAGLLLFLATLGCIVLHLAIPPLLDSLEVSRETVELCERWLTLACATLPAFGAAMGGLANQGEFVRMARRSRAMEDEFLQLSDGISALRTRSGSGEAELRLADLADQADEATRAMVEEVVEWRVIFIDRPPAAA